MLYKTDYDRTISYPLHLLVFAEQLKSNDDIHFDPERDQMIVVIDADIFESKSPAYEDVLAKAQEYKDRLAVSNPAFELFLLLHIKGSLETAILPNAEAILKNEKTNGKTFIYNLLFSHTHMNSKTNARIGELAANIDVAINQEQYLNEDILQCHGLLTCNLGRIISEIRNISEPLK